MQVGCERLGSGDRLTYVSIPFILIRARRQFGEESFPSIQVFLVWSIGLQDEPEVVGSSSRTRVVPKGLHEFRHGLVFFAQ